mgnify:CR=1 FL=1
MKVPGIFSLADRVAQQNGIDWSSTGPPSLGEMNIFGNEEAKESDPNDITANSLSVNTKPLAMIGKYTSSAKLGAEIRAVLIRAAANRFFFITLSLGVERLAA